MYGGKGVKTLEHLPVLLVLTFLSFSASAADIPPDYLGAQELDRLNCVAKAAQTCINNICLTSDERDCQDKCTHLAKKMPISRK